MNSCAGFPHRILCDFDGTVTPFDVTDAVLEKFADGEWRRLEEQWQTGILTARDCMAGQISLLRVSPKELNDFLDTVPLTDGFSEFVGYCSSHNFSLSIVSDGMDWAIRRVLLRYGLRIPVYANHLVEDGGKYHLEFPYGNSGCSSGMCKCAIAGNSPFLLIGDGSSDCCVAHKAARTFARWGKKLEKVCHKDGLAVDTYGDFHDIISLLDCYER